jgi:hypothetical protein
MSLTTMALMNIDRYKPKYMLKGHVSYYFSDHFPFSYIFLFILKRKKITKSVVRNIFVVCK